MLEESIEKARQINPDRNSNPAQNLEEYYAFVSWAETSLPWALLSQEAYPDLYDNLLQGMCAFYFLIDQPLVALEGRGLVNNSLQYAEPFASWLVSFSRSWGRFLDTEASWNDAYFQRAYADPGFGLQHGWYEDPSHWTTFNEFFTRRLKSPEVRPIAAPDLDSVVVSFADSAPMGVWAIDSLSNLVATDGIALKTATLQSVSRLIGEGSDYREAFAGGTLTHSLLSTRDYHWYHFPMGGIVREVQTIQGINPSGGSLRWDAEAGRYVFNPRAKTGWQSIETRGCVILETEQHGLVAILPVGMVAVGSVNFEPNIVPGAEVKKGDLLGHFAFGGSDIVLIFQDSVHFELNPLLREEGGGFRHVLMGEPLGFLSRKHE
jgi:phosphatidylserine decarboxylase